MLRQKAPVATLTRQYSTFWCCNSKRPSHPPSVGQNIGFPVEADEIAWFVTMIKKAAPNIAEDDLKVIETVLRTQKK